MAECYDVRRPLGSPNASQQGSPASNHAVMEIAVSAGLFGLLTYLTVPDGALPHKGDQTVAHLLRVTSVALENPLFQPNANDLDKRARSQADQVSNG